MNKIKILLVNKNLIAGGIETSLISFIEAMKDVADMDVMIFSKTGILKDKIPQDVTVYEGGKILRYLNRASENSIKNSTMSVGKKIIKGVLAFLKKIGVKTLLSKFALVGQKKLKHYDLAISFNGLNELSAKYVLKCVNAKVKINIIHSDMSRYNLTKKDMKRMLSFDKVLCVSKSCEEILKNVYPELKGKTDYLYNFQNADKIRKQAKEKDVSYPKGFNIVTVARLSEEKAHIRSLQIMKKLHEEGYRFIWNIIGEGDSRQGIEKFIAANNMCDYVILHGNQSNPYPYIKSSDFLFLGSYHEAAPMVFAEAMFLGVPVVTTNTSSAKELIEDKGFICDNTEEGIYQILKQIFSDPNILKNKKKKLENYDVKTKEMICKVLSWSKS